MKWMSARNHESMFRISARAGDSVFTLPLVGKVARRTAAKAEGRGAGWGSCDDTRASPHNNDPHPHPLPTRGRGAHRVRGQVVDLHTRLAMATLLITHPACLDHLTPAGHPERPQRLRAIDRAL